MPKDRITTIRPTPLVVTRSFAAPREKVFEAWSTAERIKRWFSPEHFSVPEAEVTFQPGGACDVCMQGPDGQRFWSRGRFVEIVPPERLVFESGNENFSAHSTVTFEVEGTGTRMRVTQRYEVHHPGFLGAIAGAEDGWRTTLDKLENEVLRNER